jgi:hypothetical protein
MIAVAKIAARTLFRSCGPMMGLKSETCRLEPQAVNGFKFYTQFGE